MKFEEQVESLYLLLYGRPARQEETRTLATAFETLSARAAAEQQNDEETSAFAWQHIIHTMLCANEFIHIK